MTLVSRFIHEQTNKTTTKLKWIFCRMTCNYVIWLFWMFETITDTLKWISKHIGFHKTLKIILLLNISIVVHKHDVTKQFLPMLHNGRQVRLGRGRSGFKNVHKKEASITKIGKKQHYWQSQMNKQWLIICWNQWNNNNIQRITKNSVRES